MAERDDTMDADLDEIDRAVAILSEALGESLDEMASGAA